MSGCGGENIDLWHRTLGHASIGLLPKLSKMALISDLYLLFYRVLR